MIVWEVRDTDGALLTTCFNERDAVAFRDRAELRLCRSGLKIEKVFNAHERDKEPVKSISKIAEAPQSAGVFFYDNINDAVGHLREVMIEIDQGNIKIKKLEIVKKHQYTGRAIDTGWVVLVRR